MVVPFAYDVVVGEFRRAILERHGDITGVYGVNGKFDNIIKKYTFCL